MTGKRYRESSKSFNARREAFSSAQAKLQSHSSTSYTQMVLLQNFARYIMSVKSRNELIELPILVHFTNRKNEIKMCGTQYKHKKNECRTIIGSPLAMSAKQSNLVSSKYGNSKPQARSMFDTSTPRKACVNSSTRKNSSSSSKQTINLKQLTQRRLDNKVVTKIKCSKSRSRSPSPPTSPPTSPTTQRRTFSRASGAQLLNRNRPLSKKRPSSRQHSTCRAETKSFYCPSLVAALA